MALEVPILRSLKVTKLTANNLFKFIKRNLITNPLHAAYPKAVFLDFYSLLYMTLFRSPKFDLQFYLQMTQPLPFKVTIMSQF